MSESAKRATALDRSPKPFALYVHIPFCVTKCPYCDFNSYAISKPLRSDQPLDMEQAYTQALCQEMRAMSHAAVWQDRRCSSIFFGGGTPSLFQATSIAEILATAAELWPWTEDIEITLEANPATLRENLALEKLLTLAHAGVNRLSFGAQSLRSHKLQRLGRLHQVDDVYRSLQLAREAGFTRINLDCMYGLVGETPSDWQTELADFISLGVSHYSAYTLTIEPGTEFAALTRKGGTLQAEEEHLAHMYRLTQEAMHSAGIAQYETSNFAIPHEECRHNVHYWSWESYLGVGAGAHSFISRCDLLPGEASIRFSAIPKPIHYIERIEQGLASAQRTEKLTPVQEKLEYLYCFLRTARGIPLRTFQELFGTDLITHCQAELDPLQSQALLTYDSQYLKLTEQGFLFSDYILGRLATAIE